MRALIAELDASADPSVERAWPETSQRRYRDEAASRYGPPVQLKRQAANPTTVRNSTRAKSNDASSGYEAVASEFMRARSLTGVAVVRRWAGALAPGATVLDLGCGHGVPLTSALIDDGLTVYGIDASPTLVAAFRDRFPHAKVACEAVERSSFFHRTFDGVIAVGLIFLMSAEAQRDLIRRVAQVLNPGGRFLFTSPAEACAWTDILSCHRSVSLGAADYKASLAGAGFTLVDEYLDEGDNHYFDARK